MLEDLLVTNASNRDVKYKSIVPFFVFGSHNVNFGDLEGKLHKNYFRNY